MSKGTCTVVIQLMIKQEEVSWDTMLLLVLFLSSTTPFDTHFASHCSCCCCRRRRRCCCCHCCSRLHQIHPV